MEALEIVNIISESLELANSGICDSMSKTMNYLLEKAAHYTKSTYGIISEKHLTDTGSLILRYHAVYGIAQTHPYMRDYSKNNYVDIVFSEDSLHNKVIVTGELVKHDNISDKRHDKLPDGHMPIKAFIAVPLKHDDEVIGILSLSRDQAYNDYDIKMLLPFSSITASIMKNILTTNELEQSKNNFMANMSHELRTPLNGIVSMTNMLSKTQLDEQQSDYVDIINHCSIQLLDIVNDILDYSKISAGKMRLHYRPVSITSCVKTVFEMLQVKASNKSLTMEYHLDEMIPSMVVGDDTRIKQIILNLLENAIKFTRSGGKIKLETNVIADTDNSIELFFKITDNGIGMPQDKIPKIFETFTQISNNYLSEGGGVGLGLPITKHLISMFDGHIWVDSELGSGTTVNFSIKLRKFKSNVSFNVLRKYFNTKKALLIDSDEGEKTLLFRTMVNLGISPIMCINLADSLLYLNHNMFVFEFVIVDITAINQDDISKLNDIKNCGVKVIIVDPSDTLSGKINYDYKINRPLDQDKLMEVFNVVYITNKYNEINSTSHLHDHNPTPSTEQSTHSNLLLSTNPVKGKEIKILVAEDNSMNQRVMVNLLNDQGYFNIDLVEDGLKMHNQLIAENYDIAFVDLKMPVLDGLSAVKQFKQHCNKDTLLIAVTASMTEETRTLCYKAGMNGFIAKPINVEDLSTVLQLVSNKHLPEST